MIDGLPEGHKCRRLHGHNYVVEFVLAAEQLDDVDMVRDYGNLEAAENEVTTLDHQHLNDIIDSTTAEALSMYLFRRVVLSIPELVAVRVSEGNNTWAEYSV
jgi:6-pyruvoyltetrahydropterin/6-carboxytetrahydropterin synthase